MFPAEFAAFDRIFWRAIEAERRRVAAQTAIPQIDLLRSRLHAETVVDHAARELLVRLSTEVLQRRTRTRHVEVREVRTRERRMIEADHLARQDWPLTWRDGLLRALSDRLWACAGVLEDDPIWADSPWGPALRRLSLWLLRRVRLVKLWRVTGFSETRPGRLVQVVTSEKVRRVAVETVHVCPHLDVPAGSGPVSFRCHMGWLAAVDDPEGVERARHELAAAARIVTQSTFDGAEFLQAARRILEIAEQWGMVP
jgi:hypothetical protein